MKFKSTFFLIALVVLTTMSGCKFYFSESEYLGTYNGEFTSYTSLYTSCNGQMVLTDAGDNLVSIEVITDSNATFYYTNVSIQRGYSIGSSSLQIEGGSQGYGGISRVTHSIYFYGEESTSSGYRFYGSR